MYISPTSARCRNPPSAEQPTIKKRRKKSVFVSCPSVFCVFIIALCLLVKVFSLTGESSVTKAPFVNKNQSEKIYVETNIAATEGDENITIWRFISLFMFMHLLAVKKEKKGNKQALINVL